MGATSRLGTAGSIDELVWAERVAPLAYWTAWATISVTFAKRDSRVVPEQWHGFEQRGSLLTSSPRLAINPANAILNYLYAILEAQTRLAASPSASTPALASSTPTTATATRSPST
ncbi:MAG TPA: hypothetical protein VJ838_03465 [Gaiellaceae bacterium]|nr:hypothetical protein [Gaiellaceae bacterium]